MFRKVAVALIAASILAGPALAQGVPGTAKQAPAAASTTVKSVKHVRKHVRTHVRHKHMRHVKHMRHAAQVKAVKQHITRHRVHTATHARPAVRSSN